MTFWGSLVAFGKLNGSINDKLGRIPARQVVNTVLGLATLALGFVATTLLGNLGHKSKTSSPPEG